MDGQVVVVRELVVTGIRGMVEAGEEVRADWFGKLKMGLQFAVLIGVLLIQWWRAGGARSSFSVLDILEHIQRILVWLMIAATIGSGVQYVVKAIRLLK